MQTRFERFNFLINQIYKSLHVIAEDVMKSCGLKGPQAIYILTLAQHPEGLTAAEICEICERDKSDVSKSMAILTDKGLLKKTANGENMYRAKLTLTPAGLDLANLVNQKSQIAVELAGQNLTYKERELVYEILGSIAERLDELSKTGLPD